MRHYSNLFYFSSTQISHIPDKGGKGVANHIFFDAGDNINTFNDHRIAMTFEIAKILTNEKIIIDNPGCIDISFPEFKDTLSKILY